MRITPILMLATIALGSHAAQAQQPSAPTKETVISSVPGKAVAATSVEVTATVTAIDKGTRTVTLKGPKGRTIDVEAGPEVRNFDQIRVGDNVVVRYLEALSLELKKTKGTPSITEDKAAVRAAPGEQPAAAKAREVRVLADVVAVDSANSTISLKGPKGNVVDMKVRNPDHFKVVKVGDQVEAVYVQAVALAVMPVPKAAGK